MLHRQYDSFMACDADYQDAGIVLFGAPFDSTTSNRPGARFGPRAIRQESFGLETYSPWLDKDLTDCTVFDAGDLELPFGDSEQTLALIREQTATILKGGKRPLMLGGEHSLTLGAVQAALEQHPQLHLIHFDAHTDLREEYLGVRFSHASVIRRCWDLMGDGRIAQFGIRSGEREEFLWAKQHTKLQPFDFAGLEDVMAALKKGDKPIYFTLDLDVLDPGCFPGTGTPEAGGVSFQELMKAIRLVMEGNVVACDVMELAPGLDVSGISTATACKVVREMLLLWGAS
jgi:agmatinase